MSKSYSLKFWANWFTAIECLETEEARGAFVMKLLRYAFEGVKPDIGPQEFPLWTLIQPVIDANLRDVANGLKGGRPKGKKARGDDENPPLEPPLERVSFLNRNIEYETLNMNHEQEGEPTKPQRRRKFAPPSLDEVKEYIAENGYQVDPDSFMAHYEANGWKVGRNPMKDWRAAVRAWHSRETKESREQEKLHADFSEYDGVI